MHCASDVHSAFRLVHIVELYSAYIEPIVTDTGWAIRPIIGYGNRSTGKETDKYFQHTAVGVTLIGITFQLQQQ